MKTRLNKLWLILLILSIILLWQIILIIITLKDNLTRTEFNLCNINLNETSSSIPRIIHQMWKNDKLSTYPINNSHSEWKRLYPNYKIILWTDEDLNKLISKSEYKYLYDTYYSYKYSIQRADLARLIVLHNQGGIYADLDVFPCSKSIEKLRLLNISFIVPRADMGSSLINHFLISQKSSYVIDYILHQTVPSKFYKRIYLIPYLEVFSTGSISLTRILRKFQLSTNNDNNLLCILSGSDVKNYVTHHIGRSWHSIDGFIINQIYEYRISFIYIIIIFSSFIFFIFIKQYFNIKFIKLRS